MPTALGMKHKLHGTTPIERIMRSTRCLNAANEPFGQLGNVFTSRLAQALPASVLFSVVWF